MAQGRDPRYDVLFEPVPIGPVVARNRFFQVPHCNGMGYRDPSAVAEMRAVKAEGGWAVVCTEETEIHPSSDLTPYIEGRLWSDADIPALALSARRIHDHGALAGIELVHGGRGSPNLTTRIPPLGPGHIPVARGYEPVQARRMDKRDIADLRRWHRGAVARALRAGFDLVYVYAGHGLTVLHHFLSRRSNDRDDEYGGSLENRMRLLRQILEDTVEEVDGRAAVACRISVQETADGGITRAEIEEVVGELGQIPDVWDFVPGSWQDDSVTSRFAPEGHEEALVKGLKALTTKPVVGVGRFTSPDMMVRMVAQGVLDFVGAARPSIADPFLPSKVEDGRIADIRECIGCNVCVAGDWTMSPIRCTQNPAMGEEWRRGWHPEHLRLTRGQERVLVIGAGPAGLEAAQSLGKRGYEVVLTERARTTGGRVTREARLPGLAEWIRVRDYRLGQIEKLANVEIYLESEMTASDVLSYGFSHAAVATGSRWRSDGVGRWHRTAMPIDHEADVLTPDDIMAGKRPGGDRVIVFDDDHYYMGGVLAELLQTEGFTVTLITPANEVSSWTRHTLEQRRIQRHLLLLGVEVVCATAVVGVARDMVHTIDVYVGEDRMRAADALVMVTARIPDDGVARELLAREGHWSDAGLVSARAIGDALSPGTIAAAVWDGRRYAEDLDAEGESPYRREVVVPGVVELEP